MTCKEIKFTIDNWVKELNYRRKYAGGGFFSSRYETVEEYHGVGQLKLMKEESHYTHPKECGKGIFKSSSIYLEKDFVEYYRNRCLR